MAAILAAQPIRRHASDIFLPDAALAPPAMRSSPPGAPLASARRRGVRRAPRPRPPLPRGRARSPCPRVHSASPRPRGSPTRRWASPAIRTPRPSTRTPRSSPISSPGRACTCTPAARRRRHRRGSRRRLLLRRARTVSVVAGRRHRGVQLVRPPTDFPYRNLTKFSLAFAWRLHSALSFGLSYAHLASAYPPVDSGVDTLNLALAGRVGRHLSWALVVRDVPGPTVGGVPLQRVLRPRARVPSAGRRSARAVRRRALRRAPREHQSSLPLVGGRASRHRREGRRRVASGY